MFPRMMSARRRHFKGEILKETELRIYRSVQALVIKEVAFGSHE
jgi:hypothetical protein